MYPVAPCTPIITLPAQTSVTPDIRTLLPPSRKPLSASTSCFPAVSDHSMRLTPSSASLRDSQLLDESDGRPLYTISTSRFGGTTTIERTKGGIDAGESVATIDFNVIRSDRITLKDVERKREVEMKVGSEYLCRPPGSSEFTRCVAE